MRKVLIINLSGIGDVISGLYVSNPLLKIDYKISYLIRDSFSGLFFDTEHDEYTNKNLPLEYFDLLIDLTSNKESRLLVNKINAKIKIGRYKNIFSKIKYSRMYTKQVKKYPKTDHIVYDYQPILDTLKVSPDKNTYLPLTIDKKYNNEVCIHIGAQNRLRCIPFGLIILTCQFFKNKKVPVRLIGYEKDIAQQILDETDNYPIYELGSLRQTKTWLNNSSLVIAPDSGIFHLASALRTPVIGIYGPNIYSRSGSINKNAQSIEKDFPCRPCNQNNECPYNIRCLKSIEFEDLYEKIIQLYQFDSQ